jgi:hypothetical protein
MYPVLTVLCLLFLAPMSHAGSNHPGPRPESRG